MGIEVLTDGSVLTLYENIRQQISADIRLETATGYWGKPRSSRNDACAKKSTAAACGSLRSIGRDWGESSPDGSLFLCLCFQQVIVPLCIRAIGICVACQDEFISGGDFLEAGTQLCVGQSHLVTHFLPLEAGK